MLQKVLQINVVCDYGSTGKIAMGIQDLLQKKGTQAVIAYGRGTASNSKNTYKITNIFEIALHILRARFSDGSGYGSGFATNRLIKYIESFKPDVIHMHNVHGYHLNIKKLFNYLNKKDIPVVWTLHDLWTMTGHCPFPADCEKWITNCNNCPKLKEYPLSYYDGSERNYLLKRKLFTHLTNCVIVCPCKWLGDLVEKSYMSCYPIKIINNGIDLSIFKPMERTSLKSKYRVEGRKVVLCVALVFDERKGFNYVLDLASKLDKNWVILVVGLDKDQLKILPANIIGYEKVENALELAELYNVADVFCNPTIGDNYPTVNLEAMACGTPVAAFDTGGIKEQVADGCGFVVPMGDSKELLHAVLESVLLSRENCSDIAKRSFDRTSIYENYFDLYNEINITKGK